MTIVTDVTVVLVVSSIMQPLHKQIMQPRHKKTSQESQTAALKHHIDCQMSQIALSTSTKKVKKNISDSSESCSTSPHKNYATSSFFWKV